MTALPVDYATLTARLDAYRRMPIPCSDQFVTRRDGHHLCTRETGHVGMHRDAGGCSWGDTDA